MDIFEHASLNALSSQRIGRFAEYWVKLAMTLADFDVYSPEVDDKGIDFVVRTRAGLYFDIQIKSVRKGTNYVFIPKHTWGNLRDNLYVNLVLINELKMPSMYLIPSIVWNEANKIFVDHKYDKPGQKSKPEWGINIPKNLDLLSEFEFMKQVEKIRIKNNVQENWK